MSNKYDLVVIGAGNGGLMTACRASRMGLKVLVIEKHNLPGGAASSFVRGRFEFEAALHEIPDFAEGENRGELGKVFDEMGIDVEMLAAKDSFRYIVEKDGVRSLDITFPHGKEAIYELMRRECPDDIEAVDKFFLAAEEMGKGLEYYGSNRGQVDPEVMKNEHQNFMRLFGLSAGEFFDSIGMSEKCKSIWSAYWPYQGADIYTVDASRYLMMVYSYVVNGAFVPKMRSHELSGAIVKRARELGCEFRFNTEVTKVLTKKGAVSGVETADGRKVSATAVVSNAFPEVVYSKLLDNKKLIPKFELQKANARHYGFRGFCVYLGLDASPEELGIEDYTIFASTTMDTRVLYESSATRSSEDYALDVCCLNIANPGCSPEGTTLLVLTIAYSEDAWADVTPENYVRIKREVADQLIDRCEKIMKTDIRSHIEEIEIATPVTFARYMNTPQGAIYGYYSDRWDGMSARMLANGAEPTVPGLFFVGGHASQLSGFRPSYMTGDITGKQVLGYVMGGGK